MRGNKEPCPKCKGAAVVNKKHRLMRPCPACGGEGVIGKKAEYEKKGSYDAS